jgi:hypothetical protein
MEDDNEEETAEDCVGLGDLGALLEIVENGVLGQLNGCQFGCACGVFGVG